METFGHLYPPQDLSDFLTQAYSVDLYHKRLTHPHMAVWFALLDADEEPAGFVAAGPCKLPVPNLEPTAGEVQQLYVRAKYQNLRLGSRLLETALDWLAGQGRTPLYVGVWSGNFGAQRLYGRYGFEKCGEYDFPVGRTLDREFILKRVCA